MIQRSNDGKIRVLSLSYGKDSLACLGAIEKLGWALDEIVHAEVWATQDIPADLPPMVEFKKKADAIINERWGFEVQHVCAMRGGGNCLTKNTSTLSQAEANTVSTSTDSRSNKEVGARNSSTVEKLTYQDIFYRIIKNSKSKIRGGRTGLPDSQYRQREVHGVSDSRPTHYRIRNEGKSILYGGTQKGECQESRIYGFPQVKGQWCNSNLKLPCFQVTPNQDGVRKISWCRISESQQTNRKGWNGLTGKQKSHRLRKSDGRKQMQSNGALKMICFHQFIRQQCEEGAGSAITKVSGSYDYFGRTIRNCGNFY